MKKILFIQVQIKKEDQYLGMTEVIRDTNVVSGIYRKKYENLKEEILYNDICTIGFAQFNTTRCKAMTKSQSKTSKSKRANQYWEKVYGIKKGSPITLNHIIALLLYCNYSDLCFEFSA
eukprot:121743_1